MVISDFDTILVSQYKYCPQCGLEIDWGDENEES